MGLIDENFRLPLCSMSSANRGKLEIVLREIDLI